MFILQELSGSNCFTLPCRRKYQGLIFCNFFPTENGIPQNFYIWTWFKNKSIEFSLDYYWCQITCQKLWQSKRAKHLVDNSFIPKVLVFFAFVSLMRAYGGETASRLFSSLMRVKVCAILSGWVNAIFLNLIKRFFEFP